MRKSLPIALGVVLLAVLAWWLMRSEPARVPPGAATAMKPGGGSGDRAPSPAPARATAAARVEQPNDLPRPAARSADAPAPPKIAEAFVSARKAPVDRRGGGADPRAGHEMEMLSYAFETLEEDIEECLGEWRKSEPQAPQQVMLAFEIDGDGLQRSWIDSDAGVPFGVRTCFSNAVYGLDWSHIIERPAMLTNRFELGDAGAP